VLIVDPHRQRQLRIRYAVVLGVAGLLALVMVSLVGGLPSTRSWGLWALFAPVYIYLEWNAFEVNDRLIASPGIMVIMTAAVAMGPQDALVLVPLMVAVASVTPVDVRLRRWFQPIANFGQLTVSAAVMVTILAIWLPEYPIKSSDLWRIAIVTVVGAVSHTFVNFQTVTFVVRNVFGRRDVRPWSNLPTIVTPSLGMGFVGGLLGAAYHLAGNVILPLIVIVFFVGHMTFASYAQLREAQESTLRGFIKALEAKDLYTRGHTERVAYFSELIGQSMGFNGTRLEGLRWAALIHDVGKLAVPRDLIRKNSRLSGEEYAQMQEHVNLVEDLLAAVDCGRFSATHGRIRLQPPCPLRWRGIRRFSRARRRGASHGGPYPGGGRLVRRNDEHSVLPGCAVPELCIRGTSPQRRVTIRPRGCGRADLCAYRTGRIVRFARDDGR